MHPSNVLLSSDGPVIVDWFDASRGAPVADVARTSLLLEGTPRHLPGADPATLAVLTDAYLARLREALDIEDPLLALWRAIEAVARLAEGMPREPLLGIWERFEGAAQATAN